MEKCPGVTLANIDNWFIDHEQTEVVEGKGPFSFNDNMNSDAGALISHLPDESRLLTVWWSIITPTSAWASCPHRRPPMNPHISVPRQHAGPAQFGGASPQNRNPFIRMPQIFGRLFKVSQMDFEMAIWEMTSLVIAPKKVFKSINVGLPLQCIHRKSWPNETCLETKNTWHRPDPSFSYLFSLFLYLTGLAWGFAYKPSFVSMNGLAIAFVLLHFLGASLVISTIMYFTVGRIFGPNGPAATISEWRGTRSSLGRMRRRAPAQGLFGLSVDKEHVEFGYCFDVSLLPACSN
ncbi:hypothetical protein MGYG_05660 [Nannizzia gypsea CBS 118893]|uniref:Integral membrane protein n=1 Tax=Arthroderma gypseum (strain ATCC MYA-4604 / CBS 118893) TaxID=535722 RepID=E4UX76_ARTGP|nr:hypothetical protein MGYG_05660 [Nannizzia gypsea CBS 118893]EFR02663.1 hypothetical protein MGYG_05660 [Nannizzia gypsea CBS 118893]